MGVVGDATRNYRTDRSDDRTGGRTVVLGWTVLCDSWTDDSMTALSATGIPRVDDQLSSDPWMVVTARTAQRRGGSLLFDVEVTYAKPDGPDEADNPLAEPMDVEVSDQVTLVPTDNDVNGAAILNSADEAFNPPPQIEVYDTLYRFGRNVEVFDRDLAAEFRGALNAGDFLGHPAGTCKLTHWQGVRQWRGNFGYFRETIEVVVRKGIPSQDDGTGAAARAWWFRTLNRGFRHVLTNPGGYPVRGEDYVYYETAKDAKGNPLSEPELLAADGTKLKQDAKAVFLEFQMNPIMDFGRLGIETSEQTQR